MHLTEDQQKQLAQFPAALRALVQAELAAGNSILEIGGGHPAPPVGACLKLAKKVSTRPRASGNGLTFYERNSSLYSGEFTDATRFFFVLEPPNPPPPEPDMDAIRKAHDPQPDAMTRLAQREPAEVRTVSPDNSPSPAASPKPRGLTVEKCREQADEATATQADVLAESATGWTRALHFRDKRPPHEVQFALERELMVLFTAAMDGNQLRMNAVATVNGAQYDFELRFVAALKSDNFYSLRVQASWADADAKYHDYFRKTSGSWFQLWTRDLVVTQLPVKNEDLNGRYQKYCETTLYAQRHLGSVEAVQRAIVGGMKSGGTFGTSHKEGGTSIYWRNGKFIRSDYGDNPGVQEFTDETQFLKALWHFCQFDVTRNVGKRELHEIDAWKLILRRMSPVCPSHPEDLRGGGIGGSSGALAGVAALPPVVGSAKVLPLSAPVVICLVAVVLVLLAAGFAARHLLSIKSTGLPLGPAVRSPTHILQLIYTTERYLPRLHRNPGKDRFRIDLLAISLEDPTRQEIFVLLRQQQANASTPMTKILGADGDVVWVQALDSFAVNLKTKRIARGADLKKLNPELGLFLNTARATFRDHFVVVSPDWSQAFALSAETLKASACPPPPRGTWMDERLLNGRVEGSLCSGGLISSNEWIAVLTAGDAQDNFKPGFSLPREFAVDEKEQSRQLYHGRVRAGDARPCIDSCERLTAADYLCATFLRTKPGGALLCLPHPDSVLLLHRPKAGLGEPLALTRLQPDGNAAWQCSTGIGRLQQVLPAAKSLALIGERPSTPGRVPEPILILINNATGATNTISLWR
jgi:hypothetical protein